MDRVFLKKSDVRAVILAAGYATRLYPLTLNMPKPLLFVRPGKTVIDFIVDQLEAVPAIKEIIVVTNHKFYSDFLTWSQRRKHSVKLTVLDDRTQSNEDRLGAVGDLYFAVKKRKVTSDLIVFGGDNLFDHGFGKFIEFAQRNRPFASLGLFDIRSKKEATRFGVVNVDKNLKVICFEEKPKKPKSTQVATCLYYFPKETLSLLTKYMKDATTKKDAPGNYIHWLLEEKGVYGFTLEQGHWVDIGHFDSYKDVVNRFNK